ncbi:unnamed protein product [Ambrosiozyma monospora]|uniref:Unnamed protein product n=1 Tax=Ambrosiozyma monospora TaxID=43982 RepID=A0A9W6Z1S3_AMBMO|nr:unnamed protein product [Ambrosiozyma monospora]
MDSVKVEMIEESVARFKKDNTKKKNIMRIENLLSKDAEAASLFVNNNDKSMIIKNQGKILTTNQLIYYFKELIGLDLSYNELYFKIKEVLRVKNKLVIRVLDTWTGEFGHMLNGNYTVYYS